MTAIVNPWVLLVWAGSLAFTAFIGYGFGQDAEIADQSRVTAAVAKAGEEAAQKSAEAISKLKVKHVTIKQQAETVIRDNPVYRDCVHPDGMLDTINQARGYEPASSGVLPAASSPR